MNEIFDDDDEPTVKIANLEENMTVHVLNALVKSVAVARDQDGIEYYKCLISDGSGLIWFYANPQSCMTLDSRRIDKGCVYCLRFVFQSNSVFFPFNIQIYQQKK
ncbi:unnamed protein product [Enterobius vermicularis]|uniref:GOLD domain-containing protein n=1 Tax=Enterobius vermicularis TaxID=51028 RepID=A0A0N4VR58_ENTVE|nr:unnamed protein product [Enterobius vermicularis]